MESTPGMHEKYPEVKDEENERSMGELEVTWQLRRVPCTPLEILWWFPTAFQIKSQLGLQGPHPEDSLILLCALAAQLLWMLTSTPSH